MVAGILAINLLAAEGGTSPVFVYKNGESSSLFCHERQLSGSMDCLVIRSAFFVESSCHYNSTLQ